MLQKKLETVEKQGSVSACSNLLSFQKPEKSQISLHGSWVSDENESSARLSETTAIRIVFGQQSNRALFVIFVKAFMTRIFTDGERVDLI